MSVGIVGYGNFGAFLEVLLKRFVPDVVVKVHSSRFSPDGAKFFSLEEVAQCDAVILAIPIHVFEETLTRILPLLGKETIIVDVATVKVHTASLLKRLASDRRYIATHPMFGPESYAKRGSDVRGFRIVITEHTLAPQEKERVITWLTQIGFDVVEMSAEAHDKHLAETLFLTHFVGQTVARAGFGRTDIDTVSFGYLMDAVESVKHDTALFADVFRYNPYCEEVLKRFEAAEHDVHALLRQSKA